MLKVGDYVTARWVKYTTVGHVIYISPIREDFPTTMHDVKIKWLTPGAWASGDGTLYLDTTLEGDSNFHPLTTAEATLYLLTASELGE